jgi:phosphoglycolate phosphatase-like HAD superfamily hydrolase
MSTIRNITAKWGKGELADMQRELVGRRLELASMQAPRERIEQHLVADALPIIGNGLENHLARHEGWLASGKQLLESAREGERRAIEKYGATNGLAQKETEFRERHEKSVAKYQTSVTRAKKLLEKLKAHGLPEAVFTQKAYEHFTPLKSVSTETPPSLPPGTVPA